MLDSVRLRLCHGAVLIALVGACTSSGSDPQENGGLGGNGGSGGRGAAGSGAGSGGANAAKSCGVPSRMRRLTVAQYRNIIQQTFSDVAGPSDSFPGPSGVGRPNTGFSNDPDYTVITTKAVEDLLDAAEEVATSVAAKANNLQGCNRDEACANKFLDKYGAQLLRHPLTDDERSTFIGVYKAGATGTNAFQDGLGAMMAALLMSPNFLFQVEIGTPTSDQNVVALTPYEKAARLSLTLWDSAPDATLLDAAKNGKLSTVDDVRAQAERMLSDDRAKATLGRFGREWLWHEPTLPKGGSKTKHAEYNDAMAASMTAEFEAFVNDQFRNKDSSSIKALFSSNKTFVDKTLAGYYGLDGSGATDGQLKPVTINDGKRAGVLTMPAVLTSLAHAEDSSFVFRGANVVKNVLCIALGDPPADAQQQGAMLTMGATNARDKSAIVVKQARCAGCHKIIDAIGLGYEGYDEIGKRRDGSVDETGEVLGVPIDNDSASGKFSSPVDLATRLGSSKAVERCMATQLYKYAYAKVPTDAQEETCAIDTLSDPGSKDLATPRDLLLRLVTSPDFGTRRIGGR